MSAHSSVIALLEDVAKSLSDGYKFGYGAADEFNSIKDKAYPYIWLDPVEGSFTDGVDAKLGNTIRWDISLNFLKLDDTHGNEEETSRAWEDTFAIMQKYIHKLDEFSLNVENLQVIESDKLTIKGTRFVARRKGTSDHVSGWTLTFQMETLAAFDYCSVYDGVSVVGDSLVFSDFSAVKLSDLMLKINYDTNGDGIVDDLLWGSITGTLSNQSDLQAALDAKQSEAIVISTSLTASLDQYYVNVASATYTDPSPAEGKGFIVFVRNGTATVGGTSYPVAGTIIHRIFHSGSWSNYVYQVAGGGGGVTPALSGSNGSFSFSTATFGNLNGLSFYTSNGSMVASYTVPAVPAQTEFVFSNSNGVSFGTNASTVTASVAAQSVQTQNLVSVQGSTGNISFSNSNGITFGFNASTITASHDGLTSQSNQAFSAGGVSSAFQTLVFQDSNGVSFSNNAGSIRASVATNYAASNHSHGNPTLALTNLSGTTASASNGFTLSLSAGAIPSVTQYFSATNTTFNGANVSGSITLNTNGLQLSLSAPTPGGGGAINVSAGTTSNNLQTVVFSNSNGVSFGLSGSTITASAVGGGGSAFGSSGLTQSVDGASTTIFNIAESYKAYGGAYIINTQTFTVAGSTSIAWPQDFQNVESVGFIQMPFSISITSLASRATTANTTFSTGATFTNHLVAYTRGVGGSSQSLQMTASTSWSWAQRMSFQANANGSQYTVSHFYSFPGSSTNQEVFDTNYAASLTNVQISTTHLTRMTGNKIMQVQWNTVFQPERMWFVYGVNSAESSNAPAATFTGAGRITTSGLGLSQVNLVWGIFGAVNNASIQGVSGVGSFTTNAIQTTTSLGFSNISSSGSHIIPYLTFARIA